MLEGKSAPSKHFCITNRKCIKRFPNKHTNVPGFVCTQRLRPRCVVLHKMRGTGSVFDKILLSNPHAIVFVNSHLLPAMRRPRIAVYNKSPVWGEFSKIKAFLVTTTGVLNRERVNERRKRRVLDENVDVWMWTGP